MSGDGRDPLEVWFPNCQFEGNNVQKAVANIFASLFQAYVADESNSTTNEQLLDSARPQGGPLVLFNSSTLGNSDLWADALENLVKFGFVINPELPANTRRPIKVAHIFYPGDQFKTPREQAVTAIDHYFMSERYKQRGVRNPAATGSGVPSPTVGGSSNNPQVSASNPLDLAGSRSPIRNPPTSSVAINTTFGNFRE